MNLKVWLLLLSLSLIACGDFDRRDGPPRSRVNMASIPNAVPQIEPRSKHGNSSSYVVKGRRYRVLASSIGYRQKGIASWYGAKFHGRPTSSGEVFNMYAMTAAHRSLPLPTYAKVTHLASGRSVVVKINDRGPFHDDRIIDLSYAAATKLGIIGVGTAWVEVRAIDLRAGYNLPMAVIGP